MTGSSDIPVFGSVAWDGHVALKFGEPLDAGGDTMCHEERVRSLVDQYVVLFHEMWAKIPWMVSWEQMDKHLAIPLQADSNGKNGKSLR